MNSSIQWILALHFFFYTNPHCTHSVGSFKLENWLSMQGVVLSALRTEKENVKAFFKVMCAYKFCWVDIKCKWNFAPHHRHTKRITGTCPTMRTSEICSSTLFFSSLSLQCITDCFCGEFTIFVCPGDLQFMAHRRLYFGELMNIS